MSARTRYELAAIPLDPASHLTGEQRAFLNGKQAAAAGRPRTSYPYMVQQRLHDAWHRGHTYEANLRRGLLPLDTARRLP